MPDYKRARGEPTHSIENLGFATCGPKVGEFYN